jgi:hypothetical protein
MNKSSFTVIPAQPGYLAIYEEDDKTVVLGDPIIAWRIETTEKSNSDEYLSSCWPITVDGDIVDNCIGVQNPNMTITLFQDELFENIESLQKKRGAKKPETV